MEDEGRGKRQRGKIRMAKVDVAAEEEQSVNRLQIE